MKLAKTILTSLALSAIVATGVNAKDLLEKDALLEMSRQQVQQAIQANPQQLIRLLETKKSYTMTEMRVLLDVIYFFQDDLRSIVGKKLVTSKDPVARYGAYQLLAASASTNEAHYGAYAGVLLKAALADTDATNLASIFNLLMIRPLPNKLVEPAKTVAFEFLKHPEDEVKTAALAFLVEQGADEAVQIELGKHLDSANPALVGPAIVFSYRVLEPSAALRASLKKVSQGKDIELAARALASLTHYDKPAR